ncbi:uncharacterized protein LOC124172272 [Ischnura elegans]|uniref:uncharacterized protein LOC124172272 n=1 Tax=Ischnura elegans TaxID=197161 RepID=UPI001ED87A36|nr:uncharacterized protein LOC124172272 [Ischnura elegans]
MYALAKFTDGDKEEVAVISKEMISSPMEKGAESYVNKEVLVRDSTKKGGREYPAIVLAHSDNRPRLCALLETYVKTGRLCTPSNSKRPHIPKTVESDSDAELGGRIGVVKKSAQLKRKKENAHQVAAMKIIRNYNNVESNNVKSSQIDVLKKELEEEKEKVRKLQAKLAEVTEQRDNLIQAGTVLESNLALAKELRRALKYSKSSPNDAQEGRALPAETSQVQGESAGVTHEHLRSKKTDIGAIPLGKSEILVNAANLRMTSNSSTSATMLARGLLELTFTKDALQNCSIRGRSSNGRGSNNEKREALFQPGVNAIIDFVLSHAGSCSWKACNVSDLVAAMGKKLNEIRATNTL